MALDIADIHELSPMQQGMLLHSLASPGGAAYVEQFECRLHGTLNAAALAEAWRFVLERHSALRSSFHVGDLEKPLQVVHREPPLPWRVCDWRGHAASEQTERLQALRRDEVAPFELTRAPLMRLALVHLGDDEHRLLWSHHHLLLDGWSVAIVFGDVCRAYGAISRGAVAELGRATQYVEWLAWSQRHSATSNEQFWRERLRGVSAFVVSQVEGAAAPRPDGERFAEHVQRIDPAVVRRVSAWAQSHQLTVNTILQGAWSLVLRRHSGRNDVMFGITTSGRADALSGMETVVGMCINTLPLRVTVTPDLRTGEWLKTVQAAHAELGRYEHTPLSDVYRWSGLPEGSPLFDTLLVMENYPADGVNRLGGALTLCGVEHRGARTRFPLTILMIPGQELTLRAVYDPSRISGATVTQMCADAAALLDALVTAHDHPLASLPLVRETVARDPVDEAPTPAPARPRDVPFAPPVTPTERTVLAVWQELVGREEIGVHDSFFAIGGHSLLAMRLLSRIREICHVQLPLRRLFDQAPTIAELAKAIEHEQIRGSSEDDLDAALCDLASLTEEQAAALLAEDEDAVRSAPAAAALPPNLPVAAAHEGRR
jgi:hypothetical protein